MTICLIIIIIITIKLLLLLLQGLPDHRHRNRAFEEHLKSAPARRPQRWGSPPRSPALSSVPLRPPSPMHPPLPAWIVSRRTLRGGRSGGAPFRGAHSDEDHLRPGVAASGSGAGRARASVLLLVVV